MQSKNQSFTCFIIGEGTLPIKCAEVRRPFYYPFSIVNITNYETLLQESLELPRKYAINLRPYRDRTPDGHT